MLERDPWLENKMRVKCVKHRSKNSDSRRIIKLPRAFTQITLTTDLLVRLAAWQSVRQKSTASDQLVQYLPECSQQRIAKLQFCTAREGYWFSVKKTTTEKYSHNKFTVQTFTVFKKLFRVPCKGRGYSSVSCWSCVPSSGDCTIYKYLE